MKKYKHRLSELHDYIRQSKANEDNINASIMCACFTCRKKFFSSAITDWAIEEDSDRKTAICPLCDADTVIPDDGRGEINAQLLEEISSYYKERIEAQRIHK